MFKTISTLLVVASALACSSAVPQPVAPTPRPHHQAHRFVVAPSTVAPRITFDLPDGWVSLARHVGSHSAGFVFGHFSPQDGQAQVEVTETKGATQPKCDDAIEYYERNAAKITMTPPETLPEGACGFSWVIEETNRAGTTLIVNLKTASPPVLTVEIAIRGLIGNEATLATYAPLIISSLHVR